jgi:hypothetical protein
MSHYSRFKKYATARPAVESLQENMSHDQVIAGLESMVAEMDRYFDEPTPALEGLGDWIGEKLGKIVKFITDSIDDFKLAFKKFKAGDWTKLDLADQEKIVKKANLTYYAYNPEDIDDLDIILNASAELSKVFSVWRVKVLTEEQVYAPINKINASLEKIVAKMTGKVPKKGNLAPADYSEFLSKLYKDGLKTYKPNESDELDSNSLPKIVSFIQKEMSKFEKLHSQLEGARNQEAMGHLAKSEKEATVRTLLAWSYLVVHCVTVTMFGPLVALVALAIYVTADKLAKLIKSDKPAMESLDETPVEQVAEMQTTEAELAEVPVVEVAPTEVPVTDVSTETVTTVEVETPAAEVTVETAPVTDVVPGVEDESDKTEETETTESTEETTESTEEVEETSETTENTETEVEEVEETTDTETAPVETEVPAETTEEAPTEEGTEAPVETPVEVVEDVVPTTEVTLDDEYTEEIEKLNSEESEVETTEADVNELEDVAAGLESLIEQLDQTRLAGGINHHMYTMVTQHAVQGYAKRVGVPTAIPGLESLAGDNVRTKLALVNAGIESASDVLKQVLEFLKNAIDNLVAGMKSFMSSLFDHKEAMKNKLKQLKEQTAKSGTQANAKVTLPGAVASQLQYDGKVDANSVKRAKAGAEQVTAYLVATGKAFSNFDNDFNKVFGSDDFDAINTHIENAVTSIISPLDKVVNVPNVSISVSMEESATGIDKAKSLKVDIVKLEALEDQDLSPIPVSTVEDFIESYIKLVEVWESDSRYRSAFGTAKDSVLQQGINGLLKVADKLNADKAPAFRAASKFVSAMLSSPVKLIAQLRRSADASLKYLELSTKAAKE